MIKLTHSLTIAAVLTTLGSFGCSTDDGDDTAGGTDASATMTATDPTDAETTDDPTDAETTDDPTDAETTDAPVDTGEECAMGSECIDDSMCDGGTCIGCICIGGGDDGPGMSDYNACDMCATGETPIGIMGLEGFCFCSPSCEGMGSDCPAPTSGGSMGICGLGAGPEPTQCVVPCQTAAQCPSGGSCEVLSTPDGDVGICTHAVP